MEKIMLPIIMILISIPLIWISVLVYRIINKYLHIRERENLFTRYVPVLSIIEGAKSTAYRKVFNDHVLAQASSGYKLSNKELKIVQREYFKLVLECCGENIVKDIEQIYGDLNSFAVVILNEFIEKVTEEESIVTGNVQDIDATKDKERKV